MVMLYQNTVLKEKVNANMQSVVDQINDSVAYAYKFDVTQDDNIKKLDKNVQIVSDSLKNVNKNIKALELQVRSDYNPGIATTFSSKQLKTASLNIGGEQSLISLGNILGTGMQWLGLMDKTEKKLNGGLAVNTMFVGTDLGVKRQLCLGETCIDEVRLKQMLESANKK